MLKIPFVILIKSKQKNEVLLERLLCERNLNNTAMTSLECNVKRISRTNVKVYITMSFSKQMNDLYVHAVAYYKYKYYERFAV